MSKKNITSKTLQRDSQITKILICFFFFLKKNANAFFRVIIVKTMLV